MSGPRPRALLAWSSGKDSAWALHALRRAGDVEVVAQRWSRKSEQSAKWINCSLTAWATPMDWSIR
ncbi:hypothetical protein SAMN02949497_4811 [Methylomagnum ishizawai]|uniref:Diphthamide synthase n=1 Tax=Methylomagnum ishizawai TaxID=1760988 RepID=A0A1Y6D4G0_9GAMM|nr:hypothetical protein SAMN02949497_4811 [Methylomagnum ishizawai]